MRIVWVCGARVVGGAEWVTIVIADGLQRRGHEVSVFCPHDGALHDELTRRGFAVHGLPIGRRSVRACHAVGRRLGTIVPDIALVTTSSEFLTTMITPRPTATRLVLARHMVQPLAWALGRLIALRADAVIAVSHAVHASLANAVDASRLHVIHNPVRFTGRDAPPTATERIQARQALGLSDDGHWVGFFGGVHETKGIRDTLNAIRAANRAGLPTHLLLGGRAHTRMPPLAELLNDYGLAGHVHFLGEITDMLAAHTAMDVVVMATHARLSEALPATLAEAMACGTPVLAYATGGMAELVGNDGEAGRLARPDDAQDLGRVLIDMLRNPSLRDDLARGALQRIRAIGDPEQAVDRYEHLFRQLR